jgi:hypothetical protein
MNQVLKYILRLEMLLLVAQILFLLPLVLLGRIIKHRFEEAMPAQPYPALIEWFFSSGVTPVLVCAGLLCGLYAIECCTNFRPPNFFLITSFSALLLYLAFFLLALLFALVYRGSVWQTPPFGL